MKHFFVASILMLLASFVVTPNTASAQQAEEKYYYYTDVKSNIIYTLYLKVSGYQVEVWMRSAQNAWEQCKVTYTSEEKISVTAKSGTAYHIKMDPRNEDALVLHNSDYSKSWKYFKQ